MESKQFNDNENQQITSRNGYSYKNTMVAVLSKTKKVVGWCFICIELY